jgi:hypothetical protein
LKTYRAQQQYISCGNGKRPTGSSFAGHALYFAAIFRGPATARRQVAYSVQ